MSLLNLLHQPIVLVNLFMINTTPTIFISVLFSQFTQFHFLSELRLIFSEAVFLAISPLVPCGNTAVSL